VLLHLAVIRNTSGMSSTYWDKGEK